MVNPKKAAEYLGINEKYVHQALKIKSPEWDELSMGEVEAAETTSDVRTAFNAARPGSEAKEIAIQKVARLL